MSSKSLKNHTFLVCKARQLSPHENISLMIFDVDLLKFDLAKVIGMLHEKEIVCLVNCVNKEDGLQYQKDYLLESAKKYTSILEDSPGLEHLTKRNFLITFDAASIYTETNNRFWFVYSYDYQTLCSLGARLATAIEVSDIVHANRVLFTHDPSSFVHLKEKKPAASLRVIKMKDGLNHTPYVDTLIFDYLYIWEMICMTVFSMTRGEKCLIEKNKHRTNILQFFKCNTSLSKHLYMFDTLVSLYTKRFEFELQPIPDLLMPGGIICITQDDIVV